MNHRDRCWKRIGVWGNEEPRCPKLEEVIHCRNCDVFTQAGRNLLERALPEEYKDEWGSILVKKKGEEPVGAIAVVVFRIESEWMALKAGLFAEIIDDVSIHTLPHRKTPVLLGLVNVHGEIQLCVSLKNLMNLEDEPDEKKWGVEKPKKRLMVVSKNGEQWVFPVNEIHGIHHFNPRLLQNVPVTIAKCKSTFTEGIIKWEEKHVALLDDELLFYNLKRSLQ
jgi:chemotaxis-related protein WspD